MKISLWFHHRMELTRTIAVTTGKGDFGLIYSSDDEAEDEEDDSQNIAQLEEESSRSSQSLSLPATSRTPESKPVNVENETSKCLSDLVLGGSSDPKRTLSTCTPCEAQSLA